MTSSPYEKARRAWFDDAERRRKAAKLPRHKLAPGTPEPPASPSMVAAWVDAIGHGRAVDALQVDRATLHRWMTGKAVPPHSAALVLRFMAEGVPPGLSDDWRGFQWRAGSVVTPTGVELSARDLEGWTWHLQRVELLETQLREARAKLAAVRALPGSANDALVSAS